MSVSFNTALNAYNSAAKISSNINGSSGTNNNESTAGSIGMAFGSALSGAVGNTTSVLRNAENVATKSLVKQADLTDVVTAITNAEVTLRTVVEVRDRFLSAYQEILKMPI